jgi:hypothetical protein
MERSMTHISFGTAICSAALLAALAAAPSAADTTATWAGTVASFSSTQIRVSHKVTGTTQNRTRLFLIGDDFQGVWTSLGNKKKKLSDLKEGETVQVTYYTDAIQHVDHARKIVIVNGFNLNINLTQTPAPVPAHSAAPTQ